MSNRARLLGVSLTLGAMLVAACGDDDDGGEAATPSAEAATTTTAAAAGTTTPAATTTEAADTTVAAGSDTSAASTEDTCTEDKKGGTLTFGSAAPITGLDPTVAQGSGVAGAIELTALYDTLLRYEPDSGTFVPHLAESFEPNADFTEWTVTLRDGVTFGNGDPFTADAVKFSIERMAQARVSSAGLAAEVAAVEVVDPLTVVFTLTEPWGGFPYLLAEDAGSIVNPNVVNALGPEGFNANPAGGGAGPFELVRYAPGEEIVMEAKADYWGGPVCIETLRFVFVPGGQATYEAFTTGELNMAFLRDAAVVDQAKSDGTEGYSSIASGSTAVLMNQGARGTTAPTTDLTIRQAVAAAIDVELLDDRTQDGKGLPSSALVWRDAPWYPGVDGPQYDPEQAAALVEQAKAAGWDGNLRLLTGDTPVAVEQGITLEALLEAAGMTITVENLPAAGVNERIAVAPDYDLAVFGLSMFEESPWARLNSYESDNVRNRTGYANPEMDAALNELKLAVTREEKKAAMAKVQEIWNKTVPTAMLAAVEEFIINDGTVHGVIYSRDTTPMFHDAYIE